MATADLAAAFNLPPEKAIAFFRQKGYAIGFKWQDVWKEAQARAFTVAGIMKLDILKDIREAFDAVLAEGGTQQAFIDRLLPVLEKKGWIGKGYVVNKETGEIEGKRLTPRRLETIFRTNMQAAYMAGRYQELLQNARARPWWEYSALMDDRVRPSHAVLNGRIFRFDDPFWKYFFPPNGFNCRCTVRARSDKDMQRLNLKPSISEGRLEMAEREVLPGDTRPAAVYADPVQGKKFIADAGFDYNPALAAYQPDMDSYPSDTGRQYVQGVLSGPEFEAAFTTLERQVNEGLAAGNTDNQLRQSLSNNRLWPVGILEPEDADFLGVATKTVWLSDDTLVKQFAHRQSDPLTLSDYRRLQRVLEKPDYRMQDKALHLKLLRDMGRWWVAVVKRTTDGTRLFLQSYYRTSGSSAERVIRRYLRETGQDQND